MVQEAKLDLALCFGVQHLPPDIARTRVARQRHRLVVRAGHPLDGHAPNLEDLSRLHWLLPTPDVTVRAEIERMFSDAGLGAPEVRVETDASASLLLPLLWRSNQVAVLAEQALQPLASEGLAVPDIAFEGLVGDVAIYP
jgi:DNA-binding transcriptional LysR family regulator